MSGVRCMDMGTRAGTMFKKNLKSQLRKSVSVIPAKAGIRCFQTPAFTGVRVCDILQFALKKQIILIRFRFLPA